MAGVRLVGSSQFFRLSYPIGRIPARDTGDFLDLFRRCGCQCSKSIDTGIIQPVGKYRTDSLDFFQRFRGQRPLGGAGRSADWDRPRRAGSRHNERFGGYHSFLTPDPIYPRRQRSCNDKTHPERFDVTVLHLNTGLPCRGASFSWRRKEYWQSQSPRHRAKPQHHPMTVTFESAPSSKSMSFPNVPSIRWNKYSCSAADKHGQGCCGQQFIHDATRDDADDWISA